MATPPTRTDSLNRRFNNPFGPGVEGNLFSPLGPARVPTNNSRSNNPFGIGRPESPFSPTLSFSPRSGGGSGRTSFRASRPLNDEDLSPL
eukprot:GGOE01003711.1.p4 GENE.GGOE01003711.1~~GGOE01003711.1.p4  ORF type:complete len:101 (-),score=22.93 GGOE01003711.1:150-419(-)